MRLDELHAMRALPSGQVEAAFRAERVLAVLPVSEPGSDETSILVATPTKLGLATLSQPTARGRWVTRWAPWDAVRLGGWAAQRSRRRGAPVRTAIRVAGRTFYTALGGPHGRDALREFSLAVQGRQAALALPHAA